MPAAALGYDLQGLLSMELLLDSLLRMTQVVELVNNPAEAVYQAREIYLDFSEDADSLSSKMAAGQVWRDLELGQDYIRSALRLNQLERYLEPSTTNTRLLTASNIPIPEQTPEGLDYYRLIMSLSESMFVMSHIDSCSKNDEIAIKNAGLESKRTKKSKQKDDTLDPDLEGEDEQLLSLRNAQYDVLLNDIKVPFERTATLLYLGQVTNLTKNFQQWFHGAGGLKKPHGLVRGTINRRQCWRYAPGNDLLAILVQLAAARQADAGGRRDGRISLRGFLQFLEQRFGMIVDRPPAEFRGPEYNAAARDNLRALQRRLQQMGMFSDLSDDFTAQQLQAPYFDSPTQEPR
jgi:hypothetical protein